VRRFLLLSLVVACTPAASNGRHGGETAAGPGERLAPNGDERAVTEKVDLGPRAPRDLPDPSACEVDADCASVGAVAPDERHPCCDVTVTVGHRSVAYMHAVEAFRASSCAEARCPPLELPGALPAECAFVTRCADLVCTGSCDVGPPN
jgi:hypothetical protein